jgi:LemA protein
MSVEENLFSFQGRTGRRTFWMFIPILIILNVGFGRLATMARIDSAAGLSVLCLVFGLPTVWITLAMCIKRFHDVNMSAWNGWVFLIWPGTQGINKYGPDPSGIAQTSNRSITLITVVLVDFIVLALSLGGHEFVIMRNKLAVERNDIDDEWRQVAADLRRRSDLVPSIVEVANGYAKQEASILTNIADAHNAISGAKTPQRLVDADNQLAGGLSRLMVIIANYPKLKSNEKFQQLQFSLKGTEMRILRSQRDYNESVQQYDRELSLFPVNIVASIAGFQHENAYHMSEVKFNSPPLFAH